MKGYGEKTIEESLNLLEQYIYESEEIINATK